MVRPFKIALAAFLLLVQVTVMFGETSEMAPAKPEQPSLRWRMKVITVTLSTSPLRPSSNVKGGTDVVAAVRRSMKTWEEAAGVEFREVFSDKQNVSPAGPAGDGVNLITVAPTAENSLLFAKNAEEVAATTRVFFDARGRISEADIVINPYQQFSADGTFGTFDLEATLTHEIGHMLGLDHSPVRGSTMYEHFGKNGVFGLQGFTHRMLSELDRTAIRAKYGWAETQTDCCGTVSTKLLLPEGRPAADLEVWLEDSATGKIVSQAVTGADGSAEIGAVPAGEYVVYSGRKDRSKRPVPMQVVGSATVAANETTTVAKRLEPGTDDIELKYTGFNGQLTLSSIPVNAGKSYTIYIGGRNLSPKNTTISFNSPFLEVSPASLVSHDFGDDVTVMSFDVAVDARIPVGEYTIFAESASGGRSAVVGGLSVRPFNNPFGSFNVSLRQ